MNDSKNKPVSNNDTKKEAVDELIKHYRATKTDISPDELFEIYGRILDEKEAAYAAFDPKI